MDIAMLFSQRGDYGTRSVICYQITILGQNERVVAFIFFLGFKQLSNIKCYFMLQGCDNRILFK